MFPDGIIPQEFVSKFLEKKLYDALESPHGIAVTGPYLHALFHEFEKILRRENHLRERLKLRWAGNLNEIWIIKKCRE